MRTAQFMHVTLTLPAPAPLRFVVLISGYAPLSAKLLQMLCEAEKRNMKEIAMGAAPGAPNAAVGNNGIRAGSWQYAGAATEALKSLPGPLIEFIQLETMAEDLSEAVAR